MRRIIKEYRLGDMTARYETDESQKVGLSLYPVSMSGENRPDKYSQVDSLVQIKLAGDMYNGAYAQGQTLREGASVKNLRYVGQEVKEEDGGLSVETFSGMREAVRCATY